MPVSRRGGAVTKRCECRGPDGKLLGNACPQLAKKSHGAPAIQQELAPDVSGKRRRFRRTGYASVKDAQTDLDRVRALLDLAGEDETAQRRVGDLLQEVMKTRAQLPDAAEVRRKLGAGVVLNAGLTVGDWLDEWVDGKKTRASTTKGYRSHIRVHLRPGVGHHLLDKFTVSQAQEYFDSIDDANEVIAAENAARREQEARATWGKRSRPPAYERERLAVEREKLAAMPPYREITGPATKQRIRATLRTSLNGAIRRQLITFNPASWVEFLESGKRPKALLWTPRHVERWRETGEKPSAVMVWTPTQIGAFLDAVEDDRLYAFFHLIAFRGLRRGEGVGVDWTHLDLDEETITIAKAITVDGWTPVEGLPKTDDAAATIALGPATAAVLREHKFRQDAERAAAGEAWTNTGKVFTDELGGWLHPEKVSDAFRAICRTADLPPINLRDLRHCAATLIHAGGGDIHTIKEVLRHSTIKLASDTYTSLLADVDQEIARKAEGVVPRARKSRAKAST